MPLKLGKLQVRQTAFKSVHRVVNLTTSKKNTGFNILYANTRTLLQIGTHQSINDRHSCRYEIKLL